MILCRHYKIVCVRVRQGTCTRSMLLTVNSMVSCSWRGCPSPPFTRSLSLRFACSRQSSLSGFDCQTVLAQAQHCYAKIQT